jgi:hypothetical protein
MKPFLLEGAWEANLSQSHRDPNHQFQQLTLHFEVSDEVVSLTFTGINKTGEPVSGTRKIHPDGKEYPVGEVPGVVEIARWVEPSILETVFMHEGTVVSESAYEVSADGKRLTSTAKGVDASGTPFEQVIVLDRV